MAVVHSPFSSFIGSPLLRDAEKAENGGLENGAAILKI
jgi:hypothetical protein